MRRAPGWRRTVYPSLRRRKTYSSIASGWIRDSKVFAGTPSASAAPSGTETGSRPSRSAFSSCRAALALVVAALCLHDPPAATAAAPEQGLLQKGSFPGSYLLPGTQVSVRVGGYLKVDVIHDFDAIGSEDSFDPRTIPTDGSEGENTQIHSRQTRLNLDVRTPTEPGDARLFVEVDFFGSGNSLRLRHAYATIGGLLAGQTWSTFMDEDALPPTLDFEEPVAYPLIRVAQVRWTQPLAQDWYVALAIEAPDSEIEAPRALGHREDPWPDLTSRLRWTHGMSHVQVSAYAGGARYRLGMGGKDDEFLWAGLLTGSVKLFGKNRFLFQLGYGDGLARYRGDLVAAPDEDGALEALPVAAVMASYEHFWTESLSSNFCYSVAHASSTHGQAGSAIQNLEYAAVNLAWRYSSWASVGVEYLYGSREDRDGSLGEANRVMVSFRFVLP